MLFVVDVCCVLYGDCYVMFARWCWCLLCGGCASLCACCLMFAVVRYLVFVVCCCLALLYVVSCSSCVVRCLSAVVRCPLFVA